MECKLKKDGIISVVGKDKNSKEALLSYTSPIGTRFKKKRTRGAGIPCVSGYFIVEDYSHYFK